jgi:hypothetical protein
LDSAEQLLRAHQGGQQLGDDASATSAERSAMPCATSTPCSSCQVGQRGTNTSGRRPPAIRQAAQSDRRSGTPARAVTGRRGAAGNDRNRLPARLSHARAATQSRTVPTVVQFHSRSGPSWIRTPVQADAQTRVVRPQQGRLCCSGGGLLRSDGRRTLGRKLRAGLALPDPLRTAACDGGLGSPLQRLLARADQRAADVASPRGV